MKNFKEERYDRGERFNGKDHSQRGPKTFRRGKAIAFLEMMNLKRSTIKQQLNEPAFQSIQQILIGELKAIDMMINEFIRLFDIHENEIMEAANRKQKTETSVSGKNDGKGIECYEGN